MVRSRFLSNGLSLALIAMALTACAEVVSVDGGGGMGGAGGAGGSGGGVAEPEIEVSIGGHGQPSGNTYVFVDTVDVGATGDLITVTISNTGDGILNISDLSVSEGNENDFVVDTDGLETAVEPDAETVFSVALAPATGGLKSFTLLISSDDADEGAYELVFEGHTTPNAYRDVTPSSSPSGRYNSAMVDLRDGRVLLFGGRNEAGTRLGDSWIYDVDAGTWTQLTPEVSPTNRDAHAMAYGAPGQVILFGGNAGCPMSGTCNLLQDTWSFDVQTMTWTELDPLVQAAGLPPARFQHGLVSIGDGKILLCGGRTAVGSSSTTWAFDTWMYDAVANTWTNLAPSTNAGRVSAFAMGADGTRVTLYGGFAAIDSPATNRTSTYDPVANVWNREQPATDPGGRAVLSGAYYENGSFIVFSGKAFTNLDPVPGTLAWDPVISNWEDITPATEPTARFNYGFAHIVGQNKAIIFSGLSKTTESGDVPAGAALGDTVEYVAPRP